MGGGLQNGTGGHIQFYPYEKVRAHKVLGYFLRDSLKF